MGETGEGRVGLSGGAFAEAPALSPAPPSPNFFQGLLSVCSSDHHLDSQHQNKLLPPRAGGDAPEPAYLWLCDLPPWGTCRLPTICASEFLGGCFPAAGEWPGQTHPGKPNLWDHGRAQNTGCKCAVKHHSAPFPQYTSWALWSLNPRRRGTDTAGVPTGARLSPWLVLRTLNQEEGVLGLSTFLLSILMSCSAHS